MMTGHRPRFWHPWNSASSALRRDAKILQKALRKAVRTSPDAFSKTVEDVKEKPLDYWIDEIRSSTWAVAQRGRKVIGIVAGKRPDSDKDIEDQTITRYIESVWISPRFRRLGLGEQLIRYLLEEEYRKNKRIRYFLLWVFVTNESAIKFYERMGFVLTSERNEGVKTEIKYRLDLDSVVNAAVYLAVNDATRRADRRQYGVTYRILGEQDTA